MKSLVIQASDDNHAAGTTAEAGLPDVTGILSAGSGAGYGSGNCLLRDDATNGSFYFTEEFRGDTWPSSWGAPGLGGKFYRNVCFSAAKSNNIYGKSDTVQPPARFVNVWKRVS